MTKWRCDECGFCVLGEQFLMAPNPFRPDEQIIGCPACGQVGNEGWTALCEIKGCGREQCCGGPVQGEYRRTCSQHAEWLERK